MEERISIAPMMEWTDAHWRSMIRGVTRRTVLYTEMVVDSTILHQNMHENFQMFIGKDIYEAPSVIQLGGNDPESMGHAASLLSDYGSYSELNLNCGCPSSRVKKFCFGASLMLQPELVREITYSMNRRSGLPVSVKCRIGVDDVDSYESLQEFVHTVSQSGVRKFVVHARKCLLSGLTTKQNRDIPPLKYEVVHKLVQDFPGYQFVVNGGVLDFESAEEHLNNGQYDWRGVTIDLPPAAGVMIGRAVYNNPLLFATADSYFFNVSDPCLSRRQVIDR
jgi:tRNA-dihydrouridine synthase A